MVLIPSRATALSVLTASLLMGPAACPRVSWASSANDQSGSRLLQAQLPAGTLIGNADCEHLVRAVRKATLAHHQEAAGILSAALAAEKDRGGQRQAARRDCSCVSLLFRAAVAAAPDEASALLETAEAACPECAEALSAALDRLSDKNAVADPRDPATAPDADPVVKDPNAPPAGLSDRDYHGLGIGSAGDPGDPGTARSSAIGGDPSVYGFGVGLGTGYPGSPGFSGTTATGTYALPPPVAPAVTSAVNR